MFLLKISVLTVLGGVSTWSDFLKAQGLDQVSPLVPLTLRVSSYLGTTTVMFLVMGTQLQVLLLC